MAWLYLTLAIATEVTGTVELRAITITANKLLPITVVTVAYAASFAFMTLALHHIGVGAVYAIWSGAGTAAVAILGWTLFGERINWPGALGIILIVIGVVVVVASGSAAHAAALSESNP